MFKTVTFFHLFTLFFKSESVVVTCSGLLELSPRARFPLMQTTKESMALLDPTILFSRCNERSAKRYCSLVRHFDLSIDHLNYKYPKLCGRTWCAYFTCMQRGKVSATIDYDSQKERRIIFKFRWHYFIYYFIITGLNNK